MQSVKPGVEDVALLNVGDVVYQYGNYGVYEKCTVDKVTPKRATLSNGHVVNREVTGKIKATYRISMPSWERGLHHYRLETPELNAEYFRKSAIKFLNDYNFGNCTDDQLTKIMAVLNQQTKQS